MPTSASNSGRGQKISLPTCLPSNRRSWRHEEAYHLLKHNSRVSNMDAAEEACRYYQKRFRIETFFSDQKSRGFHSHKSHISDPQRLSRLLIAACLAYIWIIYLERVAKLL